MSKVLDEKTQEVLRTLKVPEDEIAELAEKNKALPTEENVVEKEDATDAGTLDKSTIWTRLGEALGFGTKEVAPEASEPEEAEKTDEVIPATTAEPAEKAGGDEPDSTEEMVKAIALAVATPIGEMVRKELDARDERIKMLETVVQGLNQSVEEKVEARLRDVPEVVKVAASQVQATAVEEPVQGLTFGQKPEQMLEFNKQLVAGIAQVVDDKMKGAGFKV